MAVATTSQFWNTRMNGGDPTSLTGTNNASFTLSSGSGSVSGDYWSITNGIYAITPTTENLTMFAVFKYSSIPSDDTILMVLDNGTYRVEVKSFNQKLKLVGATTVTSIELDPSMTTVDAVPLVLRLTLDSDGNAKLYMREIIEDDDGNEHFLSVTAKASTSATIQFGNTTGTVDWATVYVTTLGAFSPDELAPSDFATDTLLRMAISIVQTLKDSKRTYLKTHVDDSAIKYGYDVSFSMLSRLTPPFINVILREIRSPTFAALGGGRIDQDYEILVYVTTRGTTHEDAYRTGLNIVGECFDEIYTTTGLKGTTDSLTSYSLELDSKLEDEVKSCTHLLTLSYTRRINTRHR